MTNRFIQRAYLWDTAITHQRNGSPVPIRIRIVLYDLFLRQSYGGQKEFKESEKLLVSVDVTNTGACTGKEVVQLYVAPKGGTIIRPVRELKAFEKQNLHRVRQKPSPLNLTAEPMHTGIRKSMTGVWRPEPMKSRFAGMHRKCFCQRKYR